ncbi:hypothetical protein RFI_39776 [Reticulomyxa filosa]|uniref:Uncharacterized protein n=1 Tax=Reticulomyxa filosa TaxID=46433 RepID=X6L8D1_RETFI|nr:hypothetical protein RFI_39776 [Reticulomyxa filosa]|eukprot:ETN97750.1 hypothetical protein RFI_39776 [Reticulomyxa filosa]
MQTIPLSGSAMQALEAFNAFNQATSYIYFISLFIVKCVCFFFKCIILNVSLFVFSTLCVVLPWFLSYSTENAFNCAKKVIEACIKTRCGIPLGVVQLSEEKSFQQTPEMKKCWEIVQTFQELTEDADITNLMQEYQNIVYKRQIERNLRIYVCEPETNVPFISLREDKDAECELQHISSTVFYKDVTTVQGELLLCAQYKDKKKNFSIKADVSIFIIPTQTHTRNQIEAEGIILNHLLDGVKDVDTLQFVLHAQKDIELVISRGLALSKQELEKKIQQFDATEMNLSSVLQTIFFFIYKKNSNNIIYKKKQGVATYTIAQMEIRTFKK